MKTKLFLIAVSSVVFAACSNEDSITELQNEQSAKGEMAIGFDSYTQRTTTRAGWVGNITTANLQNTATGALGEKGFGVFAYYTDNNDYDQQCMPNFMYNQQVKWDGSSFTYDPIKYWPNEFGGNAISDDQDKLTFFAYAPWVDIVPSTGKLVESDADASVQQWGINSISRNSATGDPLIKYIVSFDASKSVDLCWGVVKDASWTIANSGTTQPFTNGKPWLNVYRPKATDSKLTFNFNHALSQLNVTVNTFADGTSAGSVDSNTKIYVRSITFTGFAIKGALNLNNDEAGANVAYWLDYNGTNDLEAGEEITIFDGRKDGKEGTMGAVAANEKVLGLNPAIISNDDNTSVGVKGDVQNLFTGTTATTPIYVIPTGEDVKCTIVYDVETKDKKLATYLSDGKTTGSSVENRISQSINFGSTNKFENGKSYTINLHLGMNSVKVDAAVSDWTDVASQNVNLPANN